MAADQGEHRRYGRVSSLTESRPFSLTLAGEPGSKSTTGSTSSSLMVATPCASVMAKPWAPDSSTTKLSLASGVKSSTRLTVTGSDVVPGGKLS